MDFVQMYKKNQINTQHILGVIKKTTVLGVKTAYAIIFINQIVQKNLYNLNQLKHSKKKLKVCMDMVRMYRKFGNHTHHKFGVIKKTNIFG